MWKNLIVEESKRLSRENAKDIIACGFDASRTFIFSDFDYVGGLLVYLVSPLKIISGRLFFHHMYVTT
ncbi:putative tryptophan--tRNA ligase [Helianthus debilis subsp. tardiflorus]